MREERRVKRFQLAAAATTTLETQQRLLSTLQRRSVETNGVAGVGKLWAVLRMEWAKERKEEESAGEELVRVCEGAKSGRCGRKKKGKKQGAWTVWFANSLESGSFHRKIER